MLSRKRLTSEHDKGRIRGVNDRSAATARQPIKVRRNVGNAAPRCLTGTARRLPGRKPPLESHQDTAGKQADHGSPPVLRIASAAGADSRPGPRHCSIAQQDSHEAPGERKAAVPVRMCIRARLSRDVRKHGWSNASQPHRRMICTGNFPRLPRGEDREIAYMHGNAQAAQGSPRDDQAIRPRCNEIPRGGSGDDDSRVCRMESWGGLSSPPFAPSMRLREGNGVVRPRNPLGPCLAGRKWNAGKLADTYVTPIVEAGSGSIPREEVAS